MFWRTSTEGLHVHASMAVRNCGGLFLSPGLFLAVETGFNLSAHRCASVPSVLGLSGWRRRSSGRASAA